jgi:hypothetical protein
MQIPAPLVALGACERRSAGERHLAQGVRALGARRGLRWVVLQPVELVALAGQARGRPGEGVKYVARRRKPDQTSVGGRGAAATESGKG